MLLVSNLLSYQHLVPHWSCGVVDGGQKRNITLKEHEADIEVMDKRIDKELKSLCGVVKTFLKNLGHPSGFLLTMLCWTNINFLPLNTILWKWQPKHFYFTILTCMMVMKLRRYSDVVHPCMSLLIVFWTLLTADCRCICNTSGLGKTWQMLEGLTKYWGFYLVAVWDVNGVGIQDLHDALVEVNVYER